MTTHLITHLSTIFFLGPPAPGARPRGLGEHPPALPAPLRAPPKKKGPSSALMAAPPTGPLQRTVNNYFVAGCSRYFCAALCRVSRRHSPPLRARGQCRHGTLYFWLERRLSRLGRPTLSSPSWPGASGAAMGDRMGHVLALRRAAKRCGVPAQAWRSVGRQSAWRAVQALAETAEPRGPS